MADSTLNAIRTKIRRLTRSPSESQITTTEIDEYVNTFVLYDFPENLRLFSLKTTFTFYTEPNIDTYDSTTTLELTNFKDEYITVHDPVYIAGRQVFLSQSRNQFYGLYPLTNALATVGTGNGATTNYSGTLSSTPVLRNNVVFSAVDINGNGLKLYDNGTGTFDGDGTGTINYTTGAWNITFATAPEASGEIQAQTVPYQASIPTSMLYFDNKFILRPVPDRPYPVNMEVFRRPTELLLTGESPELEQWWQYVAYGAAKKIFEDKMDVESVSKILPEFRKQETLVLRRSLVQQAKERSSTIYSRGVGTGFYERGWFGDGYF